MAAAIQPWGWGDGPQAPAARAPSSQTTSTSRSRYAAGNASAVVTDAVRRVLPEARRARQRAAAQAYGEYLRRRTTQQIADDQALIESSNDIAVRDAEW
jgi:hypothetical protein